MDNGILQAPAAETADVLFAGSGELPALCRDLDWSATALGPLDGWPPALRAAIRSCLDATIPTAVWAGRDCVLIYNEAYAEVLGPDKHPWALGREAREVWGPHLFHALEFGQSVFTPIRDEGGRIIAAVNTLHDTTERAQLAERREDFLSWALTIARIGAWDLDLSDLTVRHSLQHEQIFGYDHLLPEWTYDTFMAHVLPEHRTEVERAFRHAAEHGTDWSFECRIVRRDGAIRWISSAGQYLPAAGHRDRRMVGIVQDITDRKEAEEALRLSERRVRESEARFRQLADAMPQFVWTARPGGRIDYHNQRVEELSGYTQREDGTRAWEGAVHPDDRESTVEAWRRAVQDASPYEIEHRLQRADGSMHWYLTRAVPVRDHEGRVLEWFGTTTDIDDQKRTEEALREADRQKADFLAMLSHDLRNPFAVIRTSLALLEEAGAESPQGKRALTVLGRQVNQISRLLDDLLDMTRLAKGKLQLKREPAELNAIIRAVGEDHTEVFERERIDFQVIVPPRPLCACVDRARLTQAIGNLLQNAAKFTPEGGRVRLSVCATENGYAQIDVRDNGAGIQTELLGRLFDPLMQADRTLPQSRGGLGLGLSVVKGIVELHEGRVSAFSDGPGRGAVFTIQLPLQSSSQMP